MRLGGRGGRHERVGPGGLNRRVWERVGGRCSRDRGTLGERRGGRHEAVRRAPPAAPAARARSGAGTRSGRRIIYALFDNHIAQLLDEAICQIEHLRLGKRDPRSTHRRLTEPTMPWRLEALVTSASALPLACLAARTQAGPVGSTKTRHSYLPLPYWNSQT